MAMALFAGVVTPRIAVAADLACQTWDVNVGSFNGTSALVVNVDVAGNLTGTFFGDPILGFYNRRSNELIFVRQIFRSSDPALTQTFTAYYWLRCPIGSTDCAGFLTGFYENFSSAEGVTADNHRVGWEAYCIVPG
jgi:hypothetical protein